MLCIFKYVVPQSWIVQWRLIYTDDFKCVEQIRFNYDVYLERLNHFLFFRLVSLLAHRIVSYLLVASCAYVIFFLSSLLYRIFHNRNSIEMYVMLGIECVYDFGAVITHVSSFVELLINRYRQICIQTSGQ